MGGSSSKFILPESVLDFQRCTQCKQYLSCPPTKVYPTGEVICGRCLEIFKENKLGKTSIYEKIAKTTMFPCVNRFEGCTELLEYNKVADHEKKCIGTLYECPICPKKRYEKNSLLYLIDHYRKYHKELVLSEPIIKLSYKKEILPQSYLYIDSNKLFLIEIFKTRDTLKVSASIPWKNPALVQQQVKLFENQEYPFFESHYKPCRSFVKEKQSNKNNISADTFKIFRLHYYRNEDYFWCRFEFKFSENMAKFTN